MATELASGFINLTVKYADGMKQIDSDLRGLQGTATKAGTNAGNALSTSLTRAAKIDSSDAKRALTPFEAAARRTGTDAGQELGQGIVQSARREVQSKGDKITEGLGSGAKGAGAEAGEGFLSGIGPAVASLGTKAGPIGLALLATVGIAAGIGALLAKEVMSGFERDMANRKLQVQLGIDDSQMASVNQAINNAYKNNFGESVDSLREDAASIIKNGLVQASDTKGLQAALEKVDTTAQVTGHDASEITNAVGTLIKSGVVKDYAQGLDLIVKGSQEGLDVSGDLIDTLVEYSVQFKKVGIDGPQALGLIKQLMDGGARSTDLAADAIKEFSIRAIDGSKTTTDAYAMIGVDADTMAQKLAAGGPAATEAFDTIVTKLNAIQDPVKRNAAGVALFGTQWEDLGAAMNKLDPAHARDAIGQVEGAVQKASDTLGGGALGGFESLGRTFEVLRGQFQDFLANAFGPMAQQISTWITQNLPQIIQFFTDLASAAITGTDGILGFFQFTMKWGGKWQEFMANTLGEVIKQISQFAKTAGELLKFVPGMQDEAEALIKVGQGGMDLVDGWRNGAKNMQGWSDNIGTVREGLRGVRDDVNAAGTSMANATANTQLLATGINTLPDGQIVLKDNTPEAIKRVEDLGYTVTHLPDGNLAIKVVYKDQNGQPIDPSQLGVSQRQQSAAAGNEGPKPHFARGTGAIKGPGSGTSDSILAWLSNGEGVVTAQGMASGGAPLVAALNAGWVPPAALLHSMLPGFADGGPVEKLYSVASSLVGTPYQRGGHGQNGLDCSGAASVLVNALLGLDPYGDRMATANAADWLAAKGAISGKGPAGTMRIGWKNGGPGGGHMAVTLPDGRNAESGGSVGEFTIGGGAAGADDPQFTNQAYLPFDAVFPDGSPSGGSSGSSLNYGTGSSGGSSGGGGGGGGGAATQQQLSAAQDKITDLENKVQTSQLALDEAEKDPKTKESALKAKKDAVDKNKRELDQAKQDLDTLKAKTDDSTGGSNSDNPFSQIGSGVGQLVDLAKGGIKETFLPPGFSDPESWGITKMLSGLLGFGGGVLGGLGEKNGDPGLKTAGAILGAGGQIAGGSTGDGVASLISLIPALSGASSVAPGGDNAQIVGENTAHPGTGALPGPESPMSANPDPTGGGGGGGTTTVDNSTHIAEGGQINQDATQVMEAAKRQQVAQQTPQLGTRRFV